MNLIDTSVFLGHWPFRDVRRTVADLKADLQKVGVSHAWVCSISAAFQYDPTSENKAFAQAVAEDKFFQQVVVVNPTATIIRTTQHLLAEHDIKALKIIPNYHGYSLDHASVVELAHYSSHPGHYVRESPQLPLCIQMRLQDERSHHALMKVPGVPAQAIVDLAKKVPDAKIVACAPYMSELKILSQAPNVWMELSFCESGHTLADALKHAPANRLLFGSHAPLHYPATEAAKLTSSLDIPDEVLAQIAYGNARELIAPL